MPSFLITKINIRVICLLLILFSGASLAAAQSKGNAVVTYVLAENQFATVLTSKGYVTRLALPEKADAAICGDLYDAQTGIGSFVVNSSGNDVFIKAAGTKGTSNLFVKTANFTFNFYLRVVPDNEANQVVFVRQAKPGEATTPTNTPEEKADSGKDPKKSRDKSATDKGTTENQGSSPLNDACAVQLQNAKDENARLAQENSADKEELDKRFLAIQQANRDTESVKNEYNELKHKFDDVQRQLDELKQNANKTQETSDNEKNRLEQEYKTKLVQAVVTGVRRAVVTNRHLKMGDIDISVDENLFSFNNRLYMRFTITNKAADNFSMEGLKLELRTADGVKELPIEVYEYDLEKPRTTIEVAGQKSATVVVVFDNVELDKKDKLALVAQDADKKVARLVLIN
ncbi:MAG TPA: hypothetical protein VFC63_02940 [Blastocatellia bacterium]|nr:hypothetical protein [Blastocatellia bacterium]